MRRAAAILTATLLAMSTTQAAAEVAEVRFDPRLALLPIGATVDTAQSDADRAARGEIRAAQRITADAKVYAEKEPVGAFGVNDAVTTAEPIPGFGTSRGKNPKAVINGDLAVGNIDRLPQADEDNGAIPLAADLGARKLVEIPGVIGDGPHGSAGDARGDFDYYKVTVTEPGTPLSIDVASAGGLNAVVLVYDANGGSLVYLDDPASGNVSSTVQLPAAGDWYVLVSGWGTLPSNPNDPASGGGVGSEGTYTLRVASGLDGDRDLYSVDLKAGDVLGATVNGSSHTLSFFDAAVSNPAPDPNSFNTFLAPGADKIAFIGRALGNYVSHEAGHFSGSWHTNQTNATANLMDQGGNPTQMVGAGPDRLGGNADDVDVDFTTDVYTVPFTGIEDTFSRTFWAYQ